jgi:hypothetical protein
MRVTKLMTPVDLLKVKDLYLRGSKVNIKNGRGTLLWIDDRREVGPLRVAVPIEFELCLNKHDC